MASRGTLPGRLARRLLPEDQRAHLERLRYDDAGHGYDCFGMHPDWVALTLALNRPLYERWFRVTSHGAERIPPTGPTILAANHSGTLPWDGVMLWNDVVRHTDPPRVPRAIADHFVPALPFVGTFYARTGVVGGSRGNVRRLLEGGECLMIFPEGTPGIGKPFRERYRLAEWRVGHAELAIRHRAPVVPVAIIGAEEQMPQIARLPIRAFGAPYLPVPATLLPLPVHYHVWYGEPLSLHERFPVEAADDPIATQEAAREVRAAVEGLIAHGLAERRGVFR